MAQRDDTRDPTKQALDAACSVIRAQSRLNKVLVRMLRDGHRLPPAGATKPAERTDLSCQDERKPEPGSGDQRGFQAESSGESSSLDREVDKAFTTIETKEQHARSRKRPSAA